MTARMTPNHQQPVPSRATRQEEEPDSQSASL